MRCDQSVPSPLFDPATGPSGGASGDAPSGDAGTDAGAPSELSSGVFGAPPVSGPGPGSDVIGSIQRAAQGAQDGGDGEQGEQGNAGAGEQTTGEGDGPSLEKWLGADAAASLGRIAGSLNTPAQPQMNQQVPQPQAAPETRGQPAQTQAGSAITEQEISDVAGALEKELGGDVGKKVGDLFRKLGQENTSLREQLGGFDQYRQTSEQRAHAQAYQKAGTVLQSFVDDAIGMGFTEFGEPGKPALDASGQVTNPAVAVFLQGVGRTYAAMGGDPSAPIDSGLYEQALKVTLLSQHSDRVQQHFTKQAEQNVKSKLEARAPMIDATGGPGASGAQGGIRPGASDHEFKEGVLDTIRRVASGELGAATG